MPTQACHGGMANEKFLLINARYKRGMTYEQIATVIGKDIKWVR
ncbi:hypothetical protein NIES4071_15950 [Calothrix sp. NIES-4071]|nr:hypothetical protein NIES4071_15950 [Calothrix sp. NIES-4071]BAZ55932.1 hypothetical protein NIES4105_15900 [Calothrix sp. NIES-4105]